MGARRVEGGAFGGVGKGRFPDADDGWKLYGADEVSEGTSATSASDLFFAATGVDAPFWPSRAPGLRKTCWGTLRRGCVPEKISSLIFKILSYSRTSLGAIDTELAIDPGVR